MTTAALEQPLREFLRRARDQGLPDGWLYLQDQGPSLETGCLFVQEEDELDEHGLSRAAVERGFRFEGLDGPTVNETVEWVRQFRDPPDDSLMLESYVWYLRHDSFLPGPGAPPPPPAAEIRLKIDRQFYESLGHERTGTQCAEPGCRKGAVALSSLCRRHHFEMVHKRPCPFSE